MKVCALETGNGRIRTEGNKVQVDCYTTQESIWVKVETMTTIVELYQLLVTANNPLREGNVVR